MRSDISYHGHVAMVSLLDCEWSRERHFDYRESFWHGQERLRDACKTYRDSIQNNYQAFREANRKFEEQSQDGRSAGSFESLAQYLYRPLFYLPFGHYADTIAITLLDDFNAMQHLTTGDRTSIEGIDLGFCPTLNSLGEAGETSVFCDLHDVLSSELRQFTLSAAPNGTSTDGSYEFTEHAFQEAFPLLVYSKFKFAWLGTVGYALLFQQALLKAIAKRVRKVRDELTKQCRDKPNWGLMNAEDVDMVRCVILDLQSDEEFAVLVFCRNYSVGISFVHALRSLTLGDLFQEDEHLVHALRGSREHGQAFKLYAVLDGRSSYNVDQQYDNHVFRWTKSLLAASLKATFAPEHSSCNGYLDAISHFQVSPGHHAFVESRVRRAHLKETLSPILDLSTDTKLVWLT